MKLFSGIVYGYVKKNSSYSSNVESDLKKKIF